MIRWQEARDSEGSDVRRLDRTAKWLAGLVMALCVSVMVAFGQTDDDQSRLESIISNFLSGGESDVRLYGLSGIWGGALRLQRLTVEDGQGRWLEVSGVEVDWSPLSLFRRTFRAERIHADRVEFIRPPVAGEDTQPGDGGGFSLPVDVSIEHIDLPEIVLGEGIAGDVAALSLSGSAAAARSPISIETRLSVTRADDGEGSLEADIAYLPGENRLSVELHGSEPQGGIVAGLLNLPGRPPVDIQVTGSGPLADWAGQGALSVDGAVVTRVEARHTVTDAGRRVTATGNGDLERFIPEDYRVLVEGSTAFDVAATILDAGGYDIERAEFESDTLFLSAAGRYDPSGRNDLTVSASAKNGPISLASGEDAARTTIEFTSLEGRLSGERARPSVQARVALPLVDAPGATVTGIEGQVSSTGFDLSTLSGPLEADVTVTGLDVGNEVVEPLLAGPVNLRADAVIDSDTIEIASARIEAANLSSDLSGSFSRADGAVAARIAADVAADALPEGARIVLGERVTLSANVERGGDGAIALSELDLASGDLTLTGSADLREETITANVEGALADIARLSDRASGRIAFEVEASGPLSGPDVSLTVTSDEIISAGRAITALRVEATGAASLRAPAADLSISGLVEGQQVEGTGSLSTTDGQPRIDNLLLAVGDNRIAGDLILDEERFLPIGELELAVPDLAPLAALAAQEIEGSLNGTIRFSLDAGTPSVAVDATVPRFRREAVIGEEIAIEATVENYVEAPAVSGDIRAVRVASGETLVENVSVALTRDGAWTGFDGSATVSGVPANARGRVRYVDGVATVELAAADATVQGVAMRVDRATTIVYRDGAVRLDGLVANVGGGSATVDGSAGETLSLDIRLAALPASVINAFSPGLGAEGTVSGTARVTGQTSDPSVDFDLDWNNAATAQIRSAGFGALTVSADGRFAGGRVSFDANASDGAGFNLGGGGQVTITGGPSFDLAFQGQAPFGFLSRRLAQQGVALTGTAAIDVSVRGTASSPNVTGRVRTSGARFVDARSGIAINDLTIDLGLSGQTATIRTLTGSLSSGGALSASGTIGIDPAAGFPADIKISVTEGRYVDGRLVTANFDGEIEVSGPLAREPLLGGAVNLGRTVITVPERLPGSLSQIDVRHRNAPADVRRQAEALRPASSSGEGGGLNFDLQIEAPQQIFVRGRGLDAELGGSLRLTGPASSPQAVGTFTLRRGRLAILGRRLNFTDGSIGFAGSLVPRLDFAATADAGDVEVMVRVIGPANDPGFTFTSTPTLPQDEVLAQLIFGRSLSNLSPLQIAQLAEAAAQLAGVGGGTSLFDAIRDRLGVDDLDIRTDEATGDTSVAVGKYLNDRTYLSVEKGSSSESGKIRIDLDVGRGIKLRGEAAEDGEAKGGIFIEREY
ncbi:MAG: translocation/assembly module TamB [Rhizobiaceae bacterium]|nr:translocation/assembly module TamB [Rhizobiaceae bacterium]MCV0407829.1 translocation/assembly module TamB [Rhizobiaceae bacterium]